MFVSRNFTAWLTEERMVRRNTARGFPQNSTAINKGGNALQLSSSLPASASASASATAIAGSSPPRRPPPGLLPQDPTPWKLEYPVSLLPTACNFSSPRSGGRARSPPPSRHSPPPMAATFRLLILLLIVVVPPFVRAARDADAVVSRIAFGSCANQSAPQVPDGTPTPRLRSPTLMGL